MVGLLQTICSLVYSMLLTAAGEVVGRTFAAEALPSPKWRDASPLRASTQTLINHLRHELGRPRLDKRKASAPLEMRKDRHGVGWN